MLNHYCSTTTVKNLHFNDMRQTFTHMTSIAFALLKVTKLTGARESLLVDLLIQTASDRMCIRNQNSPLEISVPLSIMLIFITLTVMFILVSIGHDKKSAIALQQSLQEQYKLNHFVREHFGARPPE